MPRPPDPHGRRGLALLLRPRDPESDPARPLAQALARRLGADLARRLGLKIAFAPCEAGAADEAEEPALGRGLHGRYVAGGRAAELGLSQAAIYDLVEALFGGDGSSPPYREARDPSQLETLVCEALAHDLAEPLSEAFAVDGLAFDGFETNAPAPVEETMSIALRMRVNGRESGLRIRAPAVWRRASAGAPRRVGPRRTLAEALAVIDTPLRVVLRERGRPLADVADLREGQILPLAATARSPAILEAGGAPLFYCALGQNEGRYTVQIERLIDAGAAPAFDARDPQ
ncbi:MAG: FliM/FliN family flagellar motor switch protein [Rhizobiales bacterium]|nr:FliM/FliN family flagellar motor switch protein [Hyphomicrobiales bacterium]